MTKRRTNATIDQTAHGEVHHRERGLRTDENGRGWEGAKEGSGAGLSGTFLSAKAVISYFLRPFNRFVKNNGKEKEEKE